MRILLILFRTGFSVQRWCIPTHRTTDVKRAWVYQGRCIHGRLCLIHRNDHNLPYPFPTEIPIYNTQHTPHRMSCTDSVQPYHHAHKQHSPDDCGMFHIGFLPHVGNIRVFLKYALTITPAGDFSTFYPVIYIIVLESIQLSGLVATHITDWANWRYMHWFVIAMVSVVWLCVLPHCG